MSVSDVTSSEKSVSAEALVERLTALETRLEALEESQPDDKVAIIVFSGDLDKVLAAFIIATGAAALGQEVSMFFT
ncbi:MAG: DsrE/DsrF/DrsH-like family protein, partial [Thermoanaerobaculia bacterium]